jgi:hypothetical protein
LLFVNFDYTSIRVWSAIKTDNEAVKADNDTALRQQELAIKAAESAINRQQGETDAYLQGIQDGVDEFERGMRG